MPRVTITVPEKNAQPYRFPLDRHSVTLGRGSENDIVMDCGSVSVKHAEMHRVQGGHELRDLGSTNGIKLNGERYEAVPLHHGMSLQLGDVAFDFLLTEEEQEALSQEKPDEASPILAVPEPSEKRLPPLKEEPPKAQPLPLPVKTNSRKKIVIVWILLAAAAFFTGMSFRFKKETGRSLLDAIWSQRPPLTPPALPKISIIVPSP
jgi:pSer/pThr/pTyr-binding forkhead associated (FHA) protein